MALLLVFSLINLFSSPPAKPANFILPSPTSPPSIPNSQTFSTPTPIPLEIVSHNPADNSQPHFAGNTTAISLTFNQPLTNAQAQNIQVTSNPEVVFFKTLHINKLTLFLRPQSKWGNHVTYRITLRSPELKTYSFKFTPTDIPDVLEMEEWGDIPN